MKKSKEVRQKKEKGVAELRQEVKKLKVELLELAAKMAVGREKNLKKARALKKEIARALTLITEKEAGGVK